MILSLAEIASMCGGTLSSGSDPKMLITDVVIDSRVVVGNTLFVAIKGDKNDGHTFVSGLLSTIKAAALVNESSELAIPNVISVVDTVLALGLLAHNYRLKFNLPIVGITGSNGKTTVKEMLYSVCKEEFGEEHVLATSGNLNNHLGMPLTLLKLTEQHKVAIIEMGMNHAGELDYLSKIANPTIAVVNNVMLAHAGFFKDLTDIAKAKGEIYNGIAKNGVALINQASPYATMWHKQITSVKQVNFGTTGSACFIKHLGHSGEVEFSTNYGDLKCNLQVLGDHNKYNALTVVALSLQLGCTLNKISKGLERYSGYKGRLERKTAFNGALIIDDSYNANPDSVKAAILAIKELPKPHWFIFADLKELGEFTESSHKEIGEFANEHGIDCLLTVGDSSKVAYSSFKADKMHFKHNQDIVEYCKQHLPLNATLLVKGSNSMNLTDVVTKLTK